MAQMLNIGKKFENFSSLEIAIQQYQKEENVQFCRRSSQTIEKAQPRMPDKKLNEHLKYYEISFHCIRGGKNFKSRSTGMREQRLPTYLPTYLPPTYLPIFVLQIMTSKPSQHTMSDPRRSAHKMPFKWHFSGGPTLSRFFMFSFYVSFDIMRKSTIIFSDKHFWCSKESSR